MKVNFNANQTNISAKKTNQNPSFGKLIVEREAAEAIKRQYRDIKNTPAQVKFIQTFKEYATRLNKLPLISYLKPYKTFTGMYPKLKLEVHDSSEGNYFRNGNVLIDVQDCAGSLDFMQGMVVYAEQLHRDNETLVKMFKDVNLEVVDEISKDVAQEAEVAENKSQAQWSAEELGKTTQAKTIIEENEHKTATGQSDTSSLEWPFFPG